MGRQEGGRKAYQWGKIWEDIVRAECLRQGVGTIDLPRVGGRMVGKKIIPQKIPFDKILFHEGITVIIDCKTYDKDVLTTSDIDLNQVRHLEHLDRRGVTAGYLIYFRKSKAVCFCRGKKLFDLSMASTNKHSIKAEQMILLGTIDNFSLTRLFSLHWERDWEVPRPWDY